MPKLFLHFGGKNPKQIVFLENPVSLLETALTGRVALEPGFHYGFVITVRCSFLKHVKPSILYHFLPGHRMALSGVFDDFPESSILFFLWRGFLT